MTSIAIILGFVAIHIASGTGPLLGASAWLAATLTLGPIALLWAVASWRLTRLLAKLDQSGEWRYGIAAEQWVGLARSGTISSFIAGVLIFGWLDVVRGLIGNTILLDELLAISPLVVGLLALAWSGAGLQRRIREAVIVRSLDQGDPVAPIPSRMGWVRIAARTQVLVSLVPLSIIIAWSEVADRLLASAPSWVIESIDADRAHTMVVLAGVLVIFAIAPLLLAVVLDTKPLGPGPILDRVRAIGRRQRVSLGRILVWRTQGMIPNAAAAGLLPGLRFVLFSDALLDMLDEDQIEAVAAHEVAHLKRRHVLWLGVGMMSLLTIGSLLGVLVVWLLDASGGVAGEFTSLLVGLPVALALFGVVSRRFEWQADAFAVRHLSESRGSDKITPEAADAMAGALLRISKITATPEQKWSWRHGSIALRVSKVRMLVGRPVNNLPADSAARTVKTLLTFAAMGTLGFLVLGWGG